MRTRTFVCDTCKMRRRFWALTSSGLRRKMASYVRVHTMFCDLDHWMRTP